MSGQRSSILTTEDSPIPKTFPIIFLCLSLLVAVPIGGMIAHSGFDGLYGQDSYAYFNYANGRLLQRLQDFEPLPPFFWPPGFPLLLVFSSLLTGFADRSSQLVSLVAGSFVPVSTALIAWELSPTKTIKYPLLVGVLAGLTGQLWQSSLVIMADTPALAVATGGIWSLIRFGKRIQYGDPGGLGSLLALAMAAGGVAFAVLTRWAYALLAVPSLIYSLYFIRKLAWRRALLHLTFAASIVLLLLSPLIGNFVSYILDPSTGTTGFFGDLVVYSWSPLNMIRRQFETVDGLLTYRFPNGIYYALAPAHRFYFTPMLAIFLLPGLWNARRHINPHWLLIISWAAIVYLFHAGAPWQNFRFTLAYLPPLAIITGLGVWSFLDSTSSYRRLAAGAIYFLGLVWMAQGGWTLTQRFISTKTADLETVEWVESEIPSNATLITFGITLTFQQYSNLETYDIYPLEPEELTDLYLTRAPFYLFLDLDNIERQWEGLSPEQNYHWLQTKATLTPVGDFRNYTLFEIESGL